MKFFSVCALAFFLLLPVSVFCIQMEHKKTFSSPVEISADSVEYNKDKNTFTARGRVDLKEGTRTLTADYMTYNENTQDVFAEGHVVLQDEGDQITCDTLRLNLETKKGTLENGKIFVKQGNFYIAGEEMHKVGEAQYTMKKGEFTTCGWDKPAWKFTANDVDVTIDGYAKTKSAKFHILDYPVFYFPWGAFPVKTERQSGFLIPEIALSTRNGKMFSNAYYWAISKDKDATFYANYIENRGVNLGTQFRYALSEDLKGSWDYFIIQDKEYEGTRWQLNGKHEQKVFGDLQIKSDIHYLSDNDLLKDFGATAAERGENQVRSTAFAEKPFSKSLLTTELSYFKNMLIRNNDQTYQYFPSISFFTEYLPVLGNKLFTDVSSDFTTFYREKGDTYSRLSFEPKLRLPYSLKGINFLVSGTLIETAYLVNRSEVIQKDTEQRQTFRLEGDANMQFIRNFSTDALGIGDMQSLIKPQLKYTFTPNTSFRDLPYIDPYDRIYQSNSITYSFNHYLYRLKEGAQRELALLEISQTYGLSGNLDPSPLYSGSGNRLSDIDARLTLNPLTHLSYTTYGVISINGDGVKSVTNSLSHDVVGKYHVNAWHSYARDFTNTAFFDLGAVYKKFEGGYQLQYSFKDKDWIDTIYRLTYSPSCWSTTLSLTQSKRPRDTRINISFNITGITSLGR
jgi:LPS-assembly protein